MFLLMLDKNFLMTNYHREDPLLHLHRNRGDPAAEPADRHDGRHLCQDRGDQERMDAAVGKVFRINVLNIV